MSLKAKIEAVIYASEEPVTLAQLAGLLSQEAQSEMDRQDSRQQTLALDGEDFPAGEGAGTSEPEPRAVSEAATEPSEPPVVSDVAAPETSAKRPAKNPAREQDRRLREYFRSLLDELIADYSTSARGIEIREVAGGFRMATKPEYHDAVRGFVKSLKPPLKLSLQALETLAVVAYKQPITAPEVSEIRGVDSSGVLGSLMGRKLVTTAGRKQVIGRPILYKTTRDFLLRFGLKDIQELPSIEEFEKMAGELADIEPVQKEIPMAEHPVQPSEAGESEPDETSHEQEQQAAAEVEVGIEAERLSTEPQADGDSTPIGVEEATGAAIADGRLSGLPPRYSEE